MVDFLAFLRNTSYPGRGILVGKDRVYYFIMGRSENSRNRIFEKYEGCTPGEWRRRIQQQKKGAVLERDG